MAGRAWTIARQGALERVPQLVGLETVDEVNTSLLLNTRLSSRNHNNWLIIASIIFETEMHD